MRFRLALLIFSFFAFFFLFFANPTFAQIPTPTQVDSGELPSCPLVDKTTKKSAATEPGITYEGAEFTTTPDLYCIDENLSSIKITFHDLSKDSAYTICTGHKDCISGKTMPENFMGGKLIKNIPEKAVGTGDLTVEICGDGSEKIKRDGCETNKNFFHGGNVYLVSIGVMKGDNYIPSKKGGFYVARSYPTFTVIPSAPLTVNGNVKVLVGTGGDLRPGEDNNNNYQLAIVGPEGYQEEYCFTLKENERMKNFSFDKFKVGRYAIFLNERINEPGKGLLKDVKNSIGVDKPLLHINIPILPDINYQPNLLNPFSYLDPFGISEKGTDPLGIIPNVDPLSIAKLPLELYSHAKRGTFGAVGKKCQGGFTFYSAACNVTPINKETGICSQPETDPEGSEYRAFLKEMVALNKIGGGISFPCANGQRYTNPAKCPSLNTAIGPMPITMEGFIESIFKYVLSIASFGAIIIIIYAGYVLMTSAGDKEKIAGARETITSAIVGLLFIILSIVILEIIGVDILKIPGITR